VKRIAIILSAVILLLLTVYGYLSLRIYNAFKNTIHADAAFIVKLNTDRLYYKLALDYLSNPAYYRSKKASQIESGLSIPAHIFIYTVKSKSAQTYFCTMEVTDTLLLKSFLKQNLGITAFQKTGPYITGTSADRRLSIAFNAGTCAMSYSFNAENVKDVIADLMNKRNLLSDKDKKVVKLKALKSDLAYVFEDYTGKGDFKDGQLHVEGHFNAGEFAGNGKTFSHRVFNTDAAVKIWLNAKPALSKSLSRVKVKNFEFYPDSLLSYCNGYFDLEMGNPVRQTDTVVTYVYNDDFEKEESITSRMVKVPGISCVVASNPAGLLGYLERVNMAYKGTVNKGLFPLYKLYLTTKQSAMILSTDQHPVVSEKRENTPYFFYLEADFEKLKSQGQFSLFEKYIRQLKQLIIKARPERITQLKHVEGIGIPKRSLSIGNVKRSHFEMDVFFNRKDVNAFSQLR
jgi:hypothetical protein